MIWLFLACQHDLAVTDAVHGVVPGGPDTAVPEREPCAENVGGALMVFAFGDAGEMTIWVEDDDFIDWAQAGQGGVPVFSAIESESGCDPEWDWHPVAEPASWSDAPEDCADLPVDDRSLTYLEGAWCPSMATLEDVEDRR